KPGGSRPRLARSYTAGMSFLRARSPVTPKMTSPQGPAIRGRRRSRGSRSGLCSGVILAGLTWWHRSVSRRGREDCRRLSRLRMIRAARVVASSFPQVGRLTATRRSGAPGSGGGDAPQVVARRREELGPAVLELAHALLLEAVGDLDER